MVVHGSRTRVWTAPPAQEHKASPGAGQLPTEARRRACPCRRLFEGYGTTTPTTEPRGSPADDPTLGRWARANRRLAIECPRNRSGRNSDDFRKRSLRGSAAVLARSVKTPFVPAGKPADRFFPDCVTY